MNERQIDLSLLGGLTVFAAYSLILPSPTALKQMDKPEELHSRLLGTAVLSAAIGAWLAHYAGNHAPFTYALAFSGIVSVIYLIEERRQT
jgi:hypothetical protein